MIRALAAVGLVLAGSGFWAAPGHRVVARVALGFLSPAAHREVVSLLGSDSAFVANATWADEIRRARRNTSRWHYVNIAPGASGYDRARDCPSGDCIVEAIRRFSEVLHDPASSRADRVEALRFVVHFVGDLHQPLHAITEERGGNDRQVRVGSRGTNLHAVWDAELVRRAAPGEAALTAEVARRVALLGPPELDVVAWTDESRELALTRAYGPERGSRLSDGYLRRGGDVVLDRLAAAARRLAALLDAAFDPEPATPGR